MKRNCNRILSVVLVLALFLSLLPALTLHTNAATVNYVYSGDYIYNWGTRGTTATFLSPNAEAFYEDNNISYSDLSALSGSSSTSSVPSSALYTKLKTLMSSNHSHKTSYNETRSLYQYTDCQGSGLTSNKISSFYSGTAIGPSWDSGKTWNREHTWPNSKGLGGSDEDDIMMLRPTSVSENSGRSNTAYGEGTGYYNPNKESGGTYNLHGDVARIMLYVYVRWGNTSKMWGSSGVMESVDVLLKWMEEDPVDTWELGRNDSVESITGTRNVFVDYPELAFILFDEEIPATMKTPSGEAANGGSYTVTATSSNTAYGTVSVSGNTITAAPADGYVVTGYTLLSGSAVVTQNGNTFTVNASSDCAVRIDFAKQSTVSVRFFENGTLTASQSVSLGNSITLPGQTEQSPEGCTFRGWVTAEVENTTTLPTVYAAGSTPVITAETAFYALYTYTDGSSGEVSTGWTLVTDASQLTPGSQLILAAADKGVVAGSMDGAYLSDVSATFSADGTTLPTPPADALILTLGGSADAWTLANDEGALLGATAVKKLAFGTTATTWSISITEGDATIHNNNTAYGRFLYNASSPRFTTYTSDTNTNMLLPQLYMMNVSTGTVYYTTGEASSALPLPTGTVKMTNLSLELESVVFINTKSAITGFEGYDLTQNMGLIMWTGDEAAYSEELFVVGNENVTVSHGATYDSATGRYVTQTPGIDAKELGDEYYLRVYVALPDGSYIYSTNTVFHGVQKYALGQLVKSSDENLKKAMVAMMDYAAAAQVQFGYRTDDLANDITEDMLTGRLGFTAEQAAGILAALETYKTDYSVDMLVSTVPADSAIVGDWTRNSAAVGCNASLLLEGIITNNYKFSLKESGKEAASAKVLFWEQETYETLLANGEPFSEANATYVYDMERDESGRYVGAYDKTAAKDMGHTLYICALITTTDGDVISSGVITHSAHAYLKGQIAGTDVNMAALAKALVVYGDTANDYFSNR